MFVFTNLLTFFVPPLVILSLFLCSLSFAHKHSSFVHDGRPFYNIHILPILSNNYSFKLYSHLKKAAGGASATRRLSYEKFHNLFKFHFFPGIQPQHLPVFIDFHNSTENCMVTPPLFLFIRGKHTQLHCWQII